MSNFGDLLGPYVVARLVEAADGPNLPRYEPARPHRRTNRSRRALFSVGSVIQFARAGDVVWGSGLNPKAARIKTLENLDIRAVRGPRTRTALIGMGLDVPAVYGDPALLLPRVHSPARDSSVGLTVIPNLHEIHRFLTSETISPLSAVETVVERIANSELVVGTSLHAIVVAEAFGVPARLIRPHAEPMFKYDDYFESTGRSPEPASDLDDALRRGGQEPGEFDPTPLLEAFPWDVIEPGLAPP